MPTEAQDYLSLYERYWQRLTELLSALPPAALNWRPPVAGEGAAVGAGAAATNTAAAIAAHVSGGQRYWIGEVIGGVPAQRDRAAELGLVVDDASQAVAHVNAAAERLRAVLGAQSAADLERTVTFNGQPVTRRWLIVYILGHTAEHWGELMLVKQLWETSQG
jgi:hypothetical protein